MNAPMNYLDGNAAAGELSRIFAADLTSAQGQCANCGVKKPFAEAHLYMQCPGIVARCAGCGHVLLRLVNVSTPSPLFKFEKTKGRFPRIVSVSASMTPRFAPTRGAKSILLMTRRSDRVMPGPPLRGIFSPSATSIT